MKISKNLIAAGVVTLVAAGSLAGVSAASAQGNGQSSLIDKIATKFNLNRDEVENTFDEFHDEKKAEHKQKQEERLGSLVAEGKLTQEQADALEAKREEMRASFEALKEEDLSPEERRAQMKQSREEFKAWAESQGIDLEAIRPEGGRKPGGPRGGLFR